MGLPGLPPSRKQPSAAHSPKKRISDIAVEKTKLKIDTKKRTAAPVSRNGHTNKYDKRLKIGTEETADIPYPVHRNRLKPRPVGIADTNQIEAMESCRNILRD